MSKRILMVVTGHGRIDAHHATGLWFEEFAVPYQLFREQGHEITVASPEGGDTPIDPRSLEGDESDVGNEAVRAALTGLPRLNGGLTDEVFDAVFFPGGHGTMFDLPDNPAVQHVVRSHYEHGHVVAAVCHGPACLVNVALRNGHPLVRGRRLTAFTDAEEREAGLDGRMPFLLESRLRERGAEFVAAGNWQDNVVVDGNLITGQNPQSSASAARAVIRALAGADGGASQTPGG